MGRLEGDKSVAVCVCSRAEDVTLKQAASRCCKLSRAVSAALLAAVGGHSYPRSPTEAKHSCLAGAPALSTLGCLPQCCRNVKQTAPPERPRAFEGMGGWLCCRSARRR